MPRDHDGGPLRRIFTRRHRFRGIGADAKEVIKALHHVEERMNHKMTTMKETLDAGFAKINVATNTIAERLRTISGGMTDPEEADVARQLDSLAGSLEAMAANPADPVPVPVPPEEV